MRWIKVDVDALTAGELLRAAALFRAFEDHPDEAGRLPKVAIWSVLGWPPGHVKRDGTAA